MYAFLTTYQCLPFTFNKSGYARLLFRCVTHLMSEQAAALARAELTFTATSSVKPVGWDYIAPEGGALIWFSAREHLTPSTSLRPEGYLTTPGESPLAACRDLYEANERYKVTAFTNLDVLQVAG